VLSDVHVGIKKPFPLDKKKYITRFTIKSPIQELENNQKDDEIKVDSEGDLVIPRRNRGTHSTLDVVNIVHSMDTPIEFVGLQVWRGALLLADFIIANEQLFKDAVILELGSGSGLVGIIAGRFCRLCYLTDYHETILLNCQRNIDLNSHMFTSSLSNPARVRLLNLLSPLEPFPSGLQGPPPYHWNTEDLTMLKSINFILASDIIYQEPLTDALFGLLEKIWTISPSMKFYLAIEKRIQFSVDFMEDVSPAYDYFVDKLITLSKTSRKLDLSFPQYLYYERVEELELWEMN